MSNINDLWKRYKEKADLAARQDIVMAYAYLARYVVDRLLVRPNSVVSYDDVLGHAVVGLIDAVEKFDPAKDVRFETYAVIRIRGGVLDAIKCLDWMPRSMRAAEQQLKREFANLEAELGRPATDEEAAARLGMDVDALNETLAQIGQSALLSLEDLIRYGDEGPSLIGLGYQPCPDDDPARATELLERKRMLAEAISALPEREKLVIALYYKEGLTLKEIAAVLGVTESRVCQLHSKAVARLHGKLARHADLLIAA